MDGRALWVARRARAIPLDRMCGCECLSRSIRLRQRQSWGARIPVAGRGMLG
jgi:hypothetical protein